MLTQAAMFLLNTLLDLFTLAVLLRFYLQLVNAPFHNPISQAVVLATNFAVRRARRVVPSWRGLDLSTLVLAFIAQLLLQLGLLWLRDYPFLVAGGAVYMAIVGLALLSMLRLSVYIFFYAVLLQAILSWVNPRTPAAPVLDSLTRPLLRPLQRRLGTGSGIDFSPLVVLIVAQLLLMLVIQPTELQLHRLL
ncbi:MAG: YggT family protein [Methylophilaceae bacterium]|nr:YggT family protein [Methylophilaceae bacterium]